LQQALGSGDQAVELGIVQGGNLGPGVDGLDKQRFAFDGVANAGHEALIQKGFGYLCLRPGAQASEGLTGGKVG
jgi:hypothetical protein